MYLGLERTRRSNKSAIFITIGAGGKCGTVRRKKRTKEREEGAFIVGKRKK